MSPRVCPHGVCEVSNAECLMRMQVKVAQETPHLFLLKGLVSLNLVFLMRPRPNQL